ncbi:ABC transporter ATP-binding protein [Trinickia caryophylli]|uniref:NitT/TauT family transport system ATP-binding protein n=2 Tax=Trinickia caryophylli TaxID=28094 RepID=A0A1X7FBU4_TRICW|nr:ABC transporter ATP-binding protein [Trinickia caryophylli]WQE10366.1 ABC transporter ATP-binding protein [Trinickia caryophylli]SMF49762.1 NitT/TauT family transport system ATP-binding protein [Trinickia caryophylli]
MHEPALLKLKNVGKTFVNSRGTREAVLQGIDLDVGPREFVSILGRSGCGKSTLLKVMGGLVTPTHGTVSLMGQKVSGPQSAVGMVFQTFALYPWLSVFDNIAFGLIARGCARAAIDAAVSPLVELIGLQGYADAYPRELSGGMRQRVGFARALAVQPDLLLLDEPFSALDMFTARKLRADLMAMWTGARIRTRSMIMVTHDVSEAVMLSDRVFLLEGRPGRITERIRIDTPREERVLGNMHGMIEYITDLLELPTGGHASHSHLSDSIGRRSGD